MKKNHGVIHILLFQTQEEDVKNYDKQTFWRRRDNQFALMERIFWMPRRWWNCRLSVFESAVYMAQAIRLKHHIWRVMWRIQTHPLHLQQDTRLHPSAAAILYNGKFRKTRKIKRASEIKMLRRYLSRAPHHLCIYWYSKYLYICKYEHVYVYICIAILGQVASTLLWI